MRLSGWRWLGVAILISESCAAWAQEKKPDAPATGGENQRLHEFFKAEWEWNLQEAPLFATHVGDQRYNDRWPDISPEAIARRKKHRQELLGKIRSFQRDRLPPEDQLNYDLFLRNASVDAELDRYPREYMPVSQRVTPPSTLADLVPTTRLASTSDYQQLINRLRAFPKYVDQTQELMRKGLQAGIMPPRVILQKVGAELEQYLASDPQKSPVYEAAFAHFPASISTAEEKRLRAEVTAAIRDAVTPSVRRFKEFFVSTYEPKARASVGISELPDGKAWYATAIRALTTTDLSAEEIHRLGLSEVARIRGEMQAAMKQAGFSGELPDFFKFLRTDPQFFFSDRNSLLMAYRDIAKRIDPELIKVFRTLPRLPYGVLPVPAHSERTQTTAYYQRGSPEAARAGIFFANTYDLKSRPKWEMEALALHEAVPGHHLQLALAQELPDTPEFRRFGGYTAFVEGWGLYAESLGPELGMYREPYSKFGQLTYEMWRAIRLVVDTGMHAKGWTREQALQFFRNNTGKAEHDMEVEVDRYISWPAQALAYKLGELKIKELRAHAAKELGARFEVREFHDRVLGSGALPLSILDARIRSWVSELKRNDPKSSAARH